MVNKLQQEREKERKERRKHARGESQVVGPVSKRSKKASTASEDELEAGPIVTLEGSAAEYEDEDELDFDELENEEFLADPDADCEAPVAKDQTMERADSTDPEPLAKLDLLYHIPKAGSVGSTPCHLHSHVSFMKFQRLVAQSFKVADLDSVAVSYKLSNRPANQRPQCLDTLEEYQNMLSEVCKALSTLKGNKKSPLPIEIFCQKRDPTPETSHPKKRSSKTSKKPTSNSDDEDKNWKILRDLRKEHACQEPGHTFCYRLDQ
ncbi:hypothetical protein FRC06_001932, partial [Ceratobasidium sp. 370]